jgi:hypothetical protein
VPDINVSSLFTGHELIEAFSEFRYKSLEEIEKFVDHVLSEDDLDNELRIFMHSFSLQYFI